MYGFLSKISDFIGLIGVTFLLSTYFAVSVDWISAKSIRYQLLNFIAAWLLLFSLYFHWNTSSVVIEIAWILVSLVGMYRILSAKIKSSTNIL